MKKIFIALKLIIVSALLNAQITRLAPSAKELGNNGNNNNQATISTSSINSILKNGKAATSQVDSLNALISPMLNMPILNKTSSIPHFSISGLGSISSTSAQVNNINPAANIGANISLSNSRKWTFYLNYNIGTNLDTTSKDSLSLPGIFFPDKSKSGFTAGLSIDIFRIWKTNKFKKIPTLNNVQIIDDNKSKFYYYTLEPYFEYSYLKRTLKQDSAITIPRIETSMETIGIRFTGNIVLEKNSFAVSLNPYFKFVNITDATFNTYNGIFLSKNNNVQLPHTVSFFGLNINLQINKTILGFTYEDLLKKRIADNNIWGGVFTLKAVIATDFFNFD